MSEHVQAKYLNEICVHVNINYNRMYTCLLCELQEVVSLKKVSFHDEEVCAHDDIYELFIQSRFLLEVIK